ncbi:long-chain-fatty-acid--CoA ligase 1-like isoform X2 [Ruditapes philippinarum]|nr:long-chain-fatty-acid--CoA ligase 1-like isoform X2 [Ruditapes philippinarum]XP_060559683.1 long-chain-fatty-acid--CoA ligase 1-like isoform X2 [Ruditapes philippinarum]
MDDYVLKLVGTGTVVATAAAYMLMNKHKPFNNCDFSEQSIEAEEEKDAKISRQAKDGKPVAFEEEDVRTLSDAFKRGARLSNNGRCLGWKPSATEPYTWISYNDVLTKASHIGAGLIAVGQTPENSTHIGIYSQNRAEYFIAEQASYLYSMCIVPLYDTLGVEACNHIIVQAELNLIICDKNEKVKNLLGRMSETPNLKTLVVMEKLSEENETLAKQHGVQLMQYEDLEKKGEAAPQEPKPCKPEDLAVICYTSGTTGLPKGAMLTHENCLAPVLACGYIFNNNNLVMTPDDCLVSYLPLAHSYERLCEACMYSGGGRIGFFQGDVRKLLDDIKELQPTVFPSVPRLLNRVYDKVMAGASASAVKSRMLAWALSSKEKEVKGGIIRSDSWWDKLVFSKVQQTLGGKVRLITTGSAPLSPKILMFLRCCAGCPVLEGYGQTECSAICSLQVPGDGEIGNVGPPLRCNYVKLVDVPDMNYMAKDDKGEVCIKGPNVFKGYLKDPEKTKEAMDEDGWLHSGDIGQWMPNGCLKIIDRKKNIFKLAQGEYIAPEKIENVYVRSTLVAQVFIHGESLKSSLVAIIVPDPDTLPGYAKEKFNLSVSMEELCKNEDIKKAILDDITSVGKKGGLASFEQAKDIYLHPELFSVENQLLTPTFKAKRNELKVFFKTQIEDMYKNLQ